MRGASREARGDRADREPEARGHRRPQRTVTRSLSLSNVAEPTSLRVFRSSTAAKRCSSRAAMIFAALTGPMPGSVSSCSAVAVFRSMGPPAARTPPRCRRHPSVARRLGRIVPRRHDDLVAVVQQRREVQRPPDAIRGDPRPIAAGRRDRVPDPGAGDEPDHARVDDRALDVDDQQLRRRANRLPERRGSRRLARIHRAPARRPRSRPTGSTPRVARTRQRPQGSPPPRSARPAATGSGHRRRALTGPVVLEASPSGVAAVSSRRHGADGWSIDPPRRVTQGSSRLVDRRDEASGTARRPATLGALPTSAGRLRENLAAATYLVVIGAPRRPTGRSSRHGGGEWRNRLEWVRRPLQARPRPGPRANRG